MADKNHLKKLNQGPEVWNRWRLKNPDIQPDLSGADPDEMYLRGVNLQDAYLDGANLDGVDLREAHLGRADLRNAHLSSADLVRADLHGAHFCGADLNGADLKQADLSAADFSGACLSRARLSGAILYLTDLSSADLSEARLYEVHIVQADLGGADLSGASVGGATFADLDLSAAKGLNAIEHLSSSHISIDTIYRSRGQIPEVFLRGCGVPDNFITYVASLTGKGFEYYSCFISYSTRDQTFAERLYADLQAKGVRCWFAPEDIAGGKKLYEQIDQAIRLHDKLLLVLSEHSIGSQWVMTEIRRARKAEARDGKRKLFPIRLVEWDVLKKWECFDADTGKDLAVEVREYFVPDFSNWEAHASYKPAFDRLLRDLKAEEG
jgi:hypothetical protein